MKHTYNFDPRPAKFAPPGSLGERIKRAREAMRMSILDVEEQSGIETRLITSLERGDQNDIKLLTACKLACALDVSVEYLAGLTEEFGVCAMNND